MDAPPHRPSRALPALPGEEISTAATRHPQQQTALSNMSSNTHIAYGAAAQGPSKRVALGDFANNTHAKPETAVIGKGFQHQRNGFAAQGQENNPTAKAFQVAPQRPKSAHVQNNNAVHNYHYNANAAQFSQAIVKPAVAKKATFVYNDNDANNAASTRPMQPTVGHFAFAGRKSPRHYKSQPQLKKADQASLRRVKTREQLRTKQPAQVIDLLSPENVPNGGAVDANANGNATGSGYALEEEAWTNLLAEKRARDSIKPVPEAVHASQQNAQQPPFQSQPVIPIVDFIAQPPVSAIQPSSTMQPAVVSQPAVTSQPAMSTQASTVNMMADTEEDWDDDEGFYEDPAYVTAHSYRSMGDNTTGGATTVILPKMNLKIQRELEAARIYTEAHLNPEETDEEMWDVSMVAEYGEEIFDYLRDMEKQMTPDPHYMDTQNELQWSMRAVLIDWVVQVHHRFNLLPETLFLTINYIDRFLSNKVVSVGKLQLVGATAIFIASKYEEINCPSVSEIVYMVDSGYTAEEILKAERFMLSMLSFELGWPGPMSFLRRISKADDYDLEIRTLAKYFLELTIMDERFVATPPSFLAAGAHYLARVMLNKGDWTKQHVHYSGYTFGQLKPLVVVMLEGCTEPRAHHAIYEKYTHQRFQGASLRVERELQMGFHLPFMPAPQRPIRHASIPNLMDEPILGHDLAHPIPISS